MYDVSKRIVSHLPGMRRLKSLLRGRRPAPRNVPDPFMVQKMLFGDSDDLVIFDVGAYIGKVAATYREMFPTATIYSFEPFPDSFQELSRAADGTHIKAYQVACSDTEGAAELQVDSDRSCNSLFPRPTNTTPYYPRDSRTVGRTVVKTQTLDAFCAKEGIDAIDILKIDVEGSELRVLNGASKKLGCKQVGLIYVEVMFVPHYEGGCLFHEVSSFLHQNEYTLFDLYDLKRASNGQLRWGNAVFVSPMMRTHIESVRS